MKGRDFPIIRLAPWEHLPEAHPGQVEARAQSVVPFVWRGEKLQVAARYADSGDNSHFIFVRFLGEEDDGNWVMSHTNIPHSALWFRLNPRLRRIPRLRLAHRLARNFSPRYSWPGRHFPFARLFYVEHVALDAAKPIRICIDISGCGTCLFPEEIFYSDAFRLPLSEAQSLRSVGGSKVLALLQEELGKEDSDVRFMLQWREKTDGEREQMVIQTRQGTLAEMRQLLTCVLRVEPSLDARYEEARWNAYEHSSTVWFDQHRWIETPFRMMSWRRIIMQHFSPIIDETLRRRHVCVRNWVDLKYANTPIQTVRPTQHERMEAALFLREWARDKVSARKLQLLLSGV